MAKRAPPTDAFMNFKDVTVDLDAADSSALVSNDENTGLSVRGALIWILHLVQVWLPYKQSAVSSELTYALSTVSGLTSMPSLGDRGLITKMHIAFFGAGTLMISPQVQHYLPPIPLAAPQITAYAQTDVNDVPYRGLEIEARLGFTTAPLDAASYTELAEVWGW